MGTRCFHLTPSGSGVKAHYDRVKAPLMNGLKSLSCGAFPHLNTIGKIGKVWGAIVAQKIRNICCFIVLDGMG